MAKIHGWVAALFVALAAVMTWPLAYNIDRAVAWPGDPFINTWILDWDWYATFHQPLSLFDANVFHPARLSLAYSENLYGIALLLFPLRAIGIPPLTAYNIAMLAGYAFSGFAAYLLGRHITGSAWAGIAAGVFYGFVPFRFTHAAHVQHVWGGWLPLLALTLMRHREQPTWKRAIACAAVFVMNGLTSIHALLFGAIAVALTLAVLRIASIRVYASGATACALLLPFLIPYVEVANLYGMERNWRETKKFSAQPADWLVSNNVNRLYHVLENGKVNPERWLFPGALCIVIGAVAIASRGPALATAWTWLILGFFGSLGTHTFFHRFLFAHVTGFRAIRVPARWAMIAYVGIAMLVALGTSVLSRKHSWAGALIAAAFVAEMWSAPFLWYMADPQPTPVRKWIAETKPRAVLELPMGGDVEYAYMFGAMHHQKTFNGVSGFAPPVYQHVSAALHQDPIPVALTEELRTMGCEYLIVHGDVDERTKAWLRALRFVRRFENGIAGDWVYSLDGRASPSPMGTPVYNDAPFGYLDAPLPNARLQGKVKFSGWALSPYGIREVNFIFNNGLVRKRARLEENRYLNEVFRFYDATTRPAFSIEFTDRPPEIWPHTDVQAEIIDGHGRHVLLQDRFINWE